MNVADKTNVDEESDYAGPKSNFIHRTESEERLQSQKDFYLRNVDRGQTPDMKMGNLLGKQDTHDFTESMVIRPNS